MKKDLTLEEAVLQIIEWRKTKTGQRGRIPQYCWRHAINLSKEHTAKVVAKKMGFKLSDLESKIKDFSHPLNHTKKKFKSKTKLRSNSLIEVPLDLMPNISNRSIENQNIIKIQKCILELDLNNGVKVRIFQ